MSNQQDERDLLSKSVGKSVDAIYNVVKNATGQRLEDDAVNNIRKECLALVRGGGHFALASIRNQSIAVAHYEADNRACTLDAVVMSIDNDLKGE